MPRLTSETKKQIRELSRTDLENIVLKFAAKDKFLLSYLQVTYLNPEYGEADLFDETRESLEALFTKSFKGKTESMRRSRQLTACLKCIAGFTKIVRKPHLEVELLLFVLDEEFGSPPYPLSAAYENRLARIAKKVIGLITTKVHEDYQLEYAGKVNGYLLTLHRTLPYNPVVRTLPHRI